MRSLRPILVAVPILILGWIISTSCEKKVIELTPSPADILPEKSFFAYVDGVEFVDTVLWAEEDAGSITITASMNGENQYPKMILTVPSDIVPGTYELGGPTSDARGIIKFGALPAEQFESIDSTSVFVVSTHFKESNIMRGKFIFTAEQTIGTPGVPDVDVSNGSFIVSY